MIRNIILLLTVVALFSSCEKFLNAKPDKSLGTPATLKDLQALLDDDEYMNSSFPSSGQVASDDYYLSTDIWNSVSALINREIYRWNVSLDYPNSDWHNTYTMVFNANVVLDNIEKVKSEDFNAKDHLKGAALFYRSYALFKGAQVFALPYSKDSAHLQLGVPLILSSDINTKNIRPSQFEMYVKLINDLKDASYLLPDKGIPATRPGKAAAYATLSYIFLITGNYDEANKYADSCLRISDQLTDYNSLVPGSNPFPLQNVEVIFRARMFSSTFLTPARAKVDSALYDSYSDDDLRKALFYKRNNDGSYAFQGSYESNPTSAAFFSGIATDEVYLLKAESLARLGKTDEAMTWLNNLLRLRWKENTFVDYTAANAGDALTIILEERRKELAFRGGIRWTDIRRLNMEPDRKITIKRVIDSEEFLLLPGDKRYAFQIPFQVVELSGIQQNER